MRDTVKEGYEDGNYLEDYRDCRELKDFEKNLLETFIEGIGSDSRIIDLGCGNGVPFDVFLESKVDSLTAVDFTEKHVEQAKMNLRDSKVIQADFSNLEYENGSFEGVVSFYALFHIPREEQEDLLKKINEWLVEGGLILITLGAGDDDESGPQVEDWHGSEMIWDNKSLKENVEMVKNSGFEILEKFIQDDEEKHLWILAEKN